MSNGISFTWGLAELDDLGFVSVYNFMLRYYSKLDIAKNEMLLLIHLSSYKYNSPNGQSRPSQSTIAEEMGYKHRQSVGRIVDKLEEKGMLKVVRRPGKPHIYDASPFAQKAFIEWQIDTRNKNLTCNERVTGSCNNSVTGGVTESLHEEEKENEIKNQLKDRENAPDGAQSQPTNKPTPKLKETEMINPFEADLDNSFQKSVNKKKKSSAKKRKKYGKSGLTIEEMLKEAEYNYTQRKNRNDGRDPLLDHPAVKIYRTYTRRYAPKVWRDELVKRIPPKKADDFGLLIKNWVGSGYNPGNVADMVSAYEEHGNSEAFINRYDGKSSNNKKQKWAFGGSGDNKPREKTEEEKARDKEVYEKVEAHRQKVLARSK